MTLDRTGHPMPSGRSETSIRWSLIALAFHPLIVDSAALVRAGSWYGFFPSYTEVLRDTLDSLFVVSRNRVSRDAVVSRLKESEVGWASFRGSCRAGAGQVVLADSGADEVNDDVTRLFLHRVTMLLNILARSKYPMR